MTCQGCTEAQAAMRKAISAVPLTVPNPRWLKRFRERAQTLLEAREMAGDFAEADMYGLDFEHECEWQHIGEWPYAMSIEAASVLDDEGIVEAAANGADWMRWKQSVLRPGVTHPALTKVEEEKRAAKIERALPNPEHDAQVARIRAGMPTECELHRALAAARLENARLQEAQRNELVGQVTRLQVKIAKSNGVELQGTVRTVTLFGERTKGQAETVRTTLKPMQPNQRARREDEQAMIQQFMAARRQGR